MTYSEERQAAYMHRLPVFAEVAAALGGSLCSLLDVPPKDPHGDRYTPGYFIHLPGELFAVSLSTCWRDPSRFSARLVVPQQFRTAASCRIMGPTDNRGRCTIKDWPTMAINRPAEDLAADIRRRCIEPGRADAVNTARALISKERTRAEKAAFLEDIARLLNVPELTSSRHGNAGWVTPGFYFTDYAADKALEGGNVHCEITVPLVAFRLIAPIIAACQNGAAAR